MVEQPQSRVGEYRSQAAKLREVAYRTQYAGTRQKLLMLADSFEKLAERVEARGDALSQAAD